MKIHLPWIGVAALLAATFTVEQAGAQYAPYRPQQQPLPQVAGYPTTAQPAIAPVAPVAQAAPAAAATPYRAPIATAQAIPAAATYPRYPQAPVAPQAAPRTAAQIPAYSYPQSSYPHTAQVPSYPVSGGPTYPSIAQQQPVPPPPTESGPTPATTPMPAPNPPEQSSMAPATNGAPSAASSAVNGAGAAGCGCNGYASTGYQTANGWAGYGQASCGYTDYGIAGACEPEGCGHVWFGGVYWLFMERDDPSARKLTARVDHNVATDPYYPQANTTILADTGYDFNSGVEVRFGSTFSIGSGCDEGCGNGYGYGCGNGCGCAPPDNFAWEVAWWGLDTDDQQSTYWDPDLLDAVRCYGMVNFAGIDYYDGATWRPVNDYYGYGMPIPDPGAPADGDIIVSAQRTRSYFSCQNIEVNIIRFPVCGMDCGSSCGAGCGSDCGYGACGCEPACNPISFSMCGMCGVRYFRIDDDFYYGSQWAMWDTGAYQPASWLNYDINVDNSLIGPQVGWNMNYCVGCKWNFFCNSTFGIFNNYIESNQRVWGENGGTRYNQTGENFNSHSDKNDISFLGELRLGGSYDVTCNWRAVMAYRALAITGVANSIDQIPTDFTNSDYPGIINSDSSIVVHGVQVGAECRY